MANIKNKFLNAHIKFTIWSVNKFYETKKLFNDFRKKFELSLTSTFVIFLIIIYILFLCFSEKFRKEIFEIFKDNITDNLATFVNNEKLYVLIISIFISLLFIQIIISALTIQIQLTNNKLNLRGNKAISYKYKKSFSYSQLFKLGKKKEFIYYSTFFISYALILLFGNSYHDLILSIIGSISTFTIFSFGDQSKKVLINIPSKNSKKYKNNKELINYCNKRVECLSAIMDSLFLITTEAICSYDDNIDHFYVVTLRV